MDNFLFDIISEHHNYPNGEPIPIDTDIDSLHREILFQGNSEKKCIEIKKDNTLHTTYYIGVDWVSKDKAIYVAPKLNTKVIDAIDSNSIKETDFIKMLFQCL